jgi:hypothetical protein
MITMTKQDIYIQSKHSCIDKSMINWEQVLQGEEVKIHGFAKPIRLDLEIEHEPNSTLTPKLLIYYIGKSRPNPPGVPWSLNEIYELGFQGCPREGGTELFI